MPPRGASPAFFEQFNQDFYPVKTHHLSRNYRSTQLILNASEQVIEKSAVSERVKVWSDFIDKTKLTVYLAPTDKAEAEYAVHEIEKMVGGTSYFSLDSDRVTDDDNASGLSFADFAVLYRTNAQSRLLDEAFQRSGIPFQTVGQTPLVAYKDMRTFLACLWHLYNPQNRFHLSQMTTKKQMKLIKTFLATIKDDAKKTVSNLLDYIEPDFVHVLADGKIIRSGDKSLAKQLEEKGRRIVRSIVRRPEERRMKGDDKN